MMADLRAHIYNPETCKYDRALLPTAQCSDGSDWGQISGFYDDNNETSGSITTGN
jgi:hypothetical protein